MSFKYIKNREEYIQFIDSIQSEFGCIEEWEEYFGFHLNWDEDTGKVLETIFDYQGEIEYCPPSFPCIVYARFGSEYDIFLGTITTRQIDFATFEELGLKLENYCPSCKEKMKE